MKNGGTKMYCPRCGEIRECQAYDIRKTYDTEGQLKESCQYSDLQWFKRARKCLSCNGEFTTVEIDACKIDELIKLRDELTQIKVIANDLEEKDSALGHLQMLQVLLRDLQKLQTPWAE